MDLIATLYLLLELLQDVVLLVVLGVVVAFVGIFGSHEIRSTWKGDHS